MAYVKYLVGLDLLGSDAKNLALETLTQNPETQLHSGRVWLDTETKQVKIYSSTEEGITVLGSTDVITATQAEAALRSGQLVVSAGTDRNVKISNVRGLFKVNEDGEVVAAAGSYLSADCVSVLSNKAFDTNRDNISGLSLSNFASDAVAEDLHSAEAGQIADAVTVEAYLDGFMASLGSFEGDLDASLGILPDGAIARGAYWRVSVEGIIGDLGFLEVGDVVVAAANNASEASDFFVMQGNLTDVVVARNAQNNRGELVGFSDNEGRTITGIGSEIRAGNKGIDLSDEAVFGVNSENILTSAARLHEVSFEASDWTGNSPHLLAIGKHGLDTSKGITVSVYDAAGDEIEVASNIAPNGDVHLRAGKSFAGSVTLYGIGREVSEEAIYGLMQVASIKDGNDSVAFQVTGDYVVDWGDGTVETYESDERASHTYDFASLVKPVEEDGHKYVQFKITPQEDSAIYGLDFSTDGVYVDMDAALGGAIEYLETGVLPDLTEVEAEGMMKCVELTIDAPDITHLTMGGSLFEEKIPPLALHLGKATVKRHSITDMSNMFSMCMLLKEVNIADHTDVVDTSWMFMMCPFLTDVGLPNTQNVINMMGMFGGCASLTNMPDIDTNNAVYMDMMFAECYNIQSINLENTSNAVSMTMAFAGCGAASIVLKDTSSVVSMEDAFAYCPNLTHVSMPRLDSLESMEKMFYECENLASVELGNTGNVTDMVSTFYNCISLTSVVIEGTSNVTDASYMFDGCTGLTSVPEMDFSSIENAAGMFRDCTGLTSVKIEDTSNVTDASYMFRDCTGLTSVKIEDTSNITDASYMFSGCAGLTSVPEMDFSSIESAIWMFNGCTGLTSVKIENTGNIVDAIGMFRDCTGLTSVEIGDSGSIIVAIGMFEGCTGLTAVPEIDFSNAVNIAEMFRGCTGLTAASIEGTNNVANMARLFEGCTNLTEVSLGDVSGVTYHNNALEVFKGCDSLNKVSLGNVINSVISKYSHLGRDSVKTVEATLHDDYTDTDGLFSHSGVEKVTVNNTTNVTKMNDMFANCKSLTSVEIEDTSNVTEMYGMFRECESLTLVPEMDTSSATNTRSMFSGTGITSIPDLDLSSAVDVGQMYARCEGLTSVEFSCTDSIRDMWAMFTGCTNLTSVSLENTGSVTNMSSLFSDCPNLTSVSLENTGSVTNMSSLFSDCPNLTSVEIEDTSNVVDMDAMFQDCTSLTAVPELSFTSTERVGYMFQRCTSLVSVDIEDASSFNEIYNMFDGCTSLVSVRLNSLNNVSTWYSLDNLFHNCPLLESAKLIGMGMSFSVANTALSYTALNTLFEVLSSAPTEGAKVNIRDTPGAATCNRSIATNKGWGVIG